MARKNSKANQELELKLELPPDQAERLVNSRPLRDVPSEQARLTSTYYDTPGLDLERDGYSLRVRHEGQRFVQTLKRNRPCAGLFSRREWEQEVVGPTISAEALADTGLRHRKRLVGNLVKQVEVDVDRRTWMLEDGVTLIEAALDQGVVRSRPKQTRFAELELELKRGSPDQLFTLARQLAAAVPLRVAVLSKAERGFGLSPGRTAVIERAHSLKLLREMSVSEAFPAVIVSCITQYRLNEDLFASNPEALHQGRVALRRLRAALTLFRRPVGDARYRGLQDEVRELANALGSARDLDVFWENYGAELSPSEQDRVRAARLEAAAIMENTLGSQKTRSLMIDLVGWSTLGAWRHSNEAGEPILRFARPELDRLWRKVRQQGAKLDELDFAERHRLRVTIKKMRYATEFLGSLFAQREVRAFRNSLVAAQDLLGDLNDQMVAQDIAAALSLTLPSSAQHHSELKALRQVSKTIVSLRAIRRFWKK